MGLGKEREKVFDALAWRLHRMGVRPDHISFLQVPVYAGMIYSAYESWRDPAVNWGLLWTFGWLQVFAFLIDGADGILARRTGQVTREGHLLDALFDIAGIGITIWAVYIHYPQLGSWLLALLLVNFFVYIQNEIQGTKSITYTRGPVTIAFVFASMYPQLLFIGIVLPLVLGVILIFTRVAWRKRFWSYWQFFTAGRREEYKAIPREQRFEAASKDPAFAMKPRAPRVRRQEDGAAAEKTEPTEPTPLSREP
ncbi:MAG: CDP-alcohol phosphatidyltransferase family protein [Euryarchaeota archaeon]|nr:CDP-alcohol phosphatidyltransferase family protein [Euryarchaeota archaeon]